MSTNTPQPPVIPGISRNLSTVSVNQRVKHALINRSLRIYLIPLSAFSGTNSLYDV